jgi:hypothetical protein
VALEVAYERYTLNTSTGSQTFTLPDSASWTPKAMILFGVTATAAGYTQELQTFMGATDGTSTFACTRASADAGAQSDTRAAIYNDAVVICNSTAVHTIASFTSFGAGQATINITDAPASAFVVHAIFLGGADLSCKVTTITHAIAGATQAYTGIGFQPQALLRFGHARATSPDTSTAHHNFQLGAVTATADTWALAVTDRDAQNTMTSSSYQRSDRSAVNVSANATPVDGEMTLLTFDSDGWTDTNNDVDASALVEIVLAMRGVSFKAGVETQKTSTGTKSISGVGFTPRLALFAGTNRAASSTLDTTLSKFSLGATDGTREGCIWTQAVDGIADAQVAQAHVTDKALRFATADSTTDAEADATLDSDGFTLDWTTADGTAREFGYLLVGEVVAASTEPVYPIMAQLGAR